MSQRAKRALSSTSSPEAESSKLSSDNNNTGKISKKAAKKGKIMAAATQNNSGTPAPIGKNIVSPATFTPVPQHSMAAGYESVNRHTATQPMQMPGPHAQHVGYHNAPGHGQLVNMDMNMHANSGYTDYQPQNIPQQPHPNYVTQPMPSEIITKLDFIMSKVSKLDAIEEQQKAILSRLDCMEIKGDENKQAISAARSDITELEKSQKFIGDQYDNVRKETDEFKQKMSKLENAQKVLSIENGKLKNDNNSLLDNIVDLQCRSMRENLIFVGISEVSQPPSPSSMETSQQVAGEGRSDQGDQLYSQVTSGSASGARGVFQEGVPAENCAEKVLHFCETVLRIENARQRVHINRAHRIGATAPGKTRSIVVRFMNTDAKMVVKNALRHVNLRESPFSVFDQFPQIVQERRRALIPVMVKARESGNKAFLVRDKLFVNNKLYNPHTK